MSVLLFFIDGLGIGSRGAHNPFDGLEGAEPLAVFENETARVVFDGLVVPTDACLGVEGRPQSASGQTTILTGINAPARLGYHKQGFPNAALREIIREHSLFCQLKARGIAPIVFANAYTQKFFAERPRWVSATTAAVEAAQIPFRTIDDLNNGAAIFMDFTNRLLIARGESVTLQTPDEAAAVLSAVVREHRFTLYEYFITDKMGHAQDKDGAQRVILELAAMIRGLLERLDHDRTTVILTSDHGNVEDLSTRNHTLNAVPTIVWGAKRRLVADRIQCLADITPAILEVLTGRETETNGHSGSKRDIT